MIQPISSETLDIKLITSMWLNMLKVLDGKFDAVNKDHMDDQVKINCIIKY